MKDCKLIKYYIYKSVLSSVSFCEMLKYSIKNLEKIMKKATENSEENLVKKTCRELGITQKELAEKLNLSLPTINRWSSDNSKIPKLGKIALSLIIENISYKFKFNQLKNAQNILQTL
jgi:DNA-binding XRE family transcriptional regulator